MVTARIWAITLNAKVAADFDVSGTTSAEDNRQVATDSAWMEIVDEALQESRTQIIMRFAGHP